MLRHTILVLLGAAILVPAANARYNPPAPSPTAAVARAATTCHQYCGTSRRDARPPAGPAVVRTELVRSPNDGFDWLDAAVGFGFALVISAAGALLIRIVGGNRTGLRPASSAS
jgi:hypothetical protein